MKNAITKAIAEGKFTADKGILINGRQVFKNAETGKIYVYNPETRKAGRYEADLTGYKQITLVEYNAQVSALKARIAANKARAEREQMKRWQTSHGEAKAADGRNKSEDATEPEVAPWDQEIQLKREERWVGGKKPEYTWPVGSFITIRIATKKGKDGKEGLDWTLDKDGYHIKFEEVRSVDGVAEPTGKTGYIHFAATQEAVDSFKKAVNRRYDNLLWNKLNEGAEHRWECKPVTDIDLEVFFLYLRKFPIKALYDHTTWVDKNTGEMRTSKAPKIRLWLPKDFEKQDNRQWQKI